MTDDRPPNSTATEEPPELASEDSTSPEPAEVGSTSPGSEATPDGVLPEDRASPSPETLDADVVTSDGEALAVEATPAALEPGQLPPGIVADGPGPKILGFEPIKPPAPPPPPKPRAKRPPRPRDPLPWPELRAAAAMVSEDVGAEALKDLFRILPDDVREETVDGVREYRKGARRPVSAYAGKSLARAVHTARRARRKPDSDDAVSEALGQALAAEVIASLDVEVAAEVILPKRDLLDRESRNARRRQKAEEDRTRDERRRRAREEGGARGGEFGGGFTGPKIRGLDEVAKLLQQQQGDDA